MRIAIIVAAALAAAGAGCAFAQVGDALLRPALTLKAPQRAVLLAAAQAGPRSVVVGERGVIAFSDDKGVSWQQASCPVSVSLTMVRFVDDRHGVAVGHGGTVLTTADAGSTWTLRLDGRRLATLAKEAATTPEAQRDAERLIADGADKPFMDVVLWDARRMLAVGAYGLAFHTADGGQTWSPWMDRLPNPKGLHWYVARRQGDALLLAGEQGLLARSSDGGKSFEALPSPYKGSWFAGEVQSDGRVVLAGLRGNAWRSSDGGSTWSQLTSPTQSAITAMAGDGQGGLLLASQAGAVLRLEGDALVPLNVQPVPLPSALLAQRQGPLLALGVAGVTPVVAREAKR